MRALFILTTTEGWAGMMYIGVDTTGVDMQPVQDSSPYMVIYFVIFMIIGSLFVMNIFVGVVIDNFNKEKAAQMAEDDPSNSKVKVFMVLKDIESIKNTKRKYEESPKDWTLPVWEVVHNDKFDTFILIIVFLNTITMAM